MTWFGLVRVLTVSGLLVSSLTGVAHAESAADAQEQARRAAAVVAELEPRVERATAEFDAALRGVGAAVNRSLTDSASADAADSAVRQRRRAASDRVRSIYIAGGPIALWSSVLDADTGLDVLRRVADVEHVVGSAQRADDGIEAQADAVRQAAVDSETEVTLSSATAADVAAHRATLEALLDQAQAALDGLSSRARQLASAEAAAAVLRAQRLAAAATQQRDVSAARAWPVPASWSTLYQSAAATCPGLPWTVLAAIGQVETGHGRNTHVSSAGAMGPMQFMPATFAAYGVDGDRDGRADITNPADSVYSAANYLCANGAGRGEASLRNAVWHYNHADWYVAMVLRIAAGLAADPARLPS